MQVYNFVWKYTSKISENKDFRALFSIKNKNIWFPGISAKFAGYQIFFTTECLIIQKSGENGLCETLATNRPSADGSTRCQYPAGNGIIIWTLSWKNCITNYFTQLICMRQICACASGFNRITKNHQCCLSIIITILKKEDNYKKSRDSFRYLRASVFRLPTFLLCQK